MDVKMQHVRLLLTVWPCLDLRRSLHVFFWASLGCITWTEILQCLQIQRCCMQDHMSAQEVWQEPYVTVLCHKSRERESMCKHTLCMYVCLCVQTNGEDRLHVGKRGLRGREWRVHITEDQCIQGRTKARERSGLDVTQSEALLTKHCCILTTPGISKHQGEFQRAAGGVGALWISEFRCRHIRRQGNETGLKWWHLHTEHMVIHDNSVTLQLCWLRLLQQSWMH